MTETLYIDSNEPPTVKQLVQTTILDRTQNTETKIKGLKTSDFIYKDVAIERKEASDLAESIKDRRLKEQTLRMKEDFQHQYIVVEGDPYNLKYSNMHDNSFIGTLVSRAADGIKVIPTPDKKGTAYALYKIIDKHQDTDNTEKRLLKKTNANAEDTKVAMLSCVEGISGEKARTIFNETKFNSVADILNENKDEAFEELQKIEGIGRKLSARIVESLME